MLHLLNSGAQGSVHIVNDIKTKETFCLKVMIIEESLKKEFNSTMEFLKSVSESDESNVFVKYVEHFFENEKGILVMEYCSGGDLQTLIKKKAIEKDKFSETEICKLIFNAATALKKLHSLGMIHRDVKDSNFLIGGDGNFKLCDFNTSKLVGADAKTSTVVGTFPNCAPEVLEGKGYSFPVDMWSLGTVLYQMMVGRTPFVTETGLNIVKLAAGEFEPISAHLGYSQLLVDLVHLCLSVDPSRRPTPAQVLASPLITLFVEVRDLRNRLQRLEMEMEVMSRKTESVRKEEHSEDVCKYDRDRKDAFRLQHSLQLSYAYRGAMDVEEMEAEKMALVCGVVLPLVSRILKRIIEGVRSSSSTDTDKKTVLMSLLRMVLLLLTNLSVKDDLVVARLSLGNVVGDLINVLRCVGSSSSTSSFSLSPSPSPSPSACPSPSSSFSSSVFTRVAMPEMQRLIDLFALMVVCCFNIC